MAVTPFRAHSLRLLPRLLRRIPRQSILAERSPDHTAPVKSSVTASKRNRNHGAENVNPAVKVHETQPDGTELPSYVPRRYARRY